MKTLTARAGKLRALAMTAAARSEALPEIPTVGEFVPGYEATGWQGIVAPKNTPTEIVDKLNEEIRAALSDAGFKFMWGLRGSFPVEIEAHITERD
jgi:tripartite-type tricarboxylate transporter receptor subunit TctC